MKAPASFCHAAATTGRDDNSPFFLGDFIYANGGFRYIDTKVMYALSNAPPVRMRIGGSVAKARLVNRVDPVYPPLAIENRVEGTVRLHVILAKDGTVRSITVMGGDPMLQLAAVDALKQWRYQPTLLNGEPVEVDTEVDVLFQLRN